MVVVKVGQRYRDLFASGAEMTILELPNQRGDFGVTRHIKGEDFPGVSNTCALSFYYELVSEPKPPTFFEEGKTYYSIPGNYGYTEVKVHAVREISGMQYAMAEQVWRGKVTGQNEPEIAVLDMADWESDWLSEEKPQ